VERAEVGVEGKRFGSRIHLTERAAEGNATLPISSAVRSHTKIILLAYLFPAARFVGEVK